MNVSESKKGFTETYVVKFWLEGKDGFWAQKEINLYSNSNSNIEEIEKYFDEQIKPSYKHARLLSIRYS